MDAAQLAEADPDEPTAPYVQLLEGEVGTGGGWKREGAGGEEGKDEGTESEGGKVGGGWG